MAWGNGRKAFECDYEYTYVVEEDDGTYSLCKPNFHRIRNFGPNLSGLRRAEGVGHGISHRVITMCDVPEGTF